SASASIVPAEPSSPPRTKNVQSIKDRVPIEPSIVLTIGVIFEVFGTMLSIAAALLALFLSNEAHAADAARDCAETLVASNLFSKGQIQELLDRYGLIWLRKEIGLLQLHPRWVRDDLERVVLNDRSVSNWVDTFQRKGIGFRLPEYDVLIQ